MSGAGGRGAPPPPSGDGGRPGRDRGQALAEMALALPALLLLVFGIIEFGSAWRSHQVVTNAAREGARRAVMPLGFVDPREGAVRTIIEDVMTAGGLTYSDDFVTLTCNGSAGLCDSGRGNVEEVQIDYPYSFVLLGPLADLACQGAGCDGSSFGTITLTATSTMRQE